MKTIAFISVTVVLRACTAMSTLFKRKNKTAAAVETRITVTGSTKNISGHAAVVANSTVIYYMDGMDIWGDSWLDQKVKVTGDLEVVGKESFAKNEIDREIKIIKSPVVLLQPNNK